MVRAASDRKLTIVEIFRGVELDAGLECFSALFEDFLHLRRNPLLRFFLGFVSFEFEMAARIGFNQGFIQQPSQGLCGPIRVLTIFMLAAGAARNFACGYPLAGKGFQVGADFSFFAVHARRSVFSIQCSMSSQNASAKAVRCISTPPHTDCRGHGAPDSRSGRCTYETPSAARSGVGRSGGGVQMHPTASARARLDRART